MILVDVAAKIAEPLKKQFREARRAFQDFVKDFVKGMSDVDKAARKTGGAADVITDAMRNRREMERNRARQFNSPLTSLMRRDPAFKDVLSQLYGQGSGRGLIRQLIKSGSTKGSNDLYRRFKSGELAKMIKVQEKELTVQKKQIPVLNSIANIWQRLLKYKDDDAKKTNTLNRLKGNYLSRLRRQIVGTAAAYISFYSAARLARSVFGNTSSIEQDAFGGQVPFGSKQNFLKAREFAQSMNLRGVSGFNTQSTIEGFKELMQAGIDPRKNFQMIADIAGKSGKQLNEVATDIVSAIYGNPDVLRKYGLNNQQIFSLNKLVDKRPDTRKNVIMQMLAGNKSFKGGMQEFAMSWKGLMNQMKTWWEFFTEAVMGSVTDKNSLFNRIKNVWQLIIGWLQKNKQRIQRLGIAIGEIGKWVVRQIVQVGRWLARQFEGFLGNLDGTTEKFQTTVMKVVLWLELTKMRIVNFFKTYGGLIKTLLYVWLGIKVWRTFASGVGLGINALESLVNVFKLLTRVGEGFVGVLARMAPFIVELSPVIIAVTAALWLQKRAVDANREAWDRYYGLLRQEAQKAAPNNVVKQAQLISSTQSLYKLGRGQSSIAGTMASANNYDAAALAAAGGNSNIIKPNGPQSGISNINTRFKNMLNKAFGFNNDDALQGVLRSGISADQIDKQYNFQQPITIVVQGSNNPVDTANQVKRALEEEAAAGGFPNGMRNTDTRKFMAPSK